MRRAYFDNGFLENENGVFGVTLGYDYCAEHEWGIEGIKKSLGIKELTRWTAGIKSRRIHRHDYIVYKEDGEYTYLFMGMVGFDKTLNERVPYSLDKDALLSIELLNKEQEKQRPLIVTAWSSNAFGMLVKGDEHRKVLKDTYDAIKDGDAAIAMLSPYMNNPFANASLSVIIISRLSKTLLQQMKDLDKKTMFLEKASKKHGFHKRLCERLPYVSCSIHDIGNDQKERYDTKYDYVFWVNSSNVSGYFSVEALERFLKDKTVKLNELKK